MKNIFNQITILSTLIALLTSASSFAADCDPNARVTRTGLWSPLGNEPGEDCSGRCFPEGATFCEVMPIGSRFWYKVYQREILTLNGCGQLVDQKVETARVNLGCFSR